MYDRDIEQKNKKREWEVEDIKREQNAEYRKLILEFTKDPYLEKDRKFNTEATKVDDSHPYIARLLSYIETPSQNNQTNHQ